MPTMKDDEQGLNEDYTIISMSKSRNAAYHSWWRREARSIVDTADKETLQALESANPGASTRPAPATKNQRRAQKIRLAKAIMNSHRLCLTEPPPLPSGNYHDPSMKPKQLFDDANNVNDGSRASTKRPSSVNFSIHSAKKKPRIEIPTTTGGSEPLVSSKSSSTTSAASTVNSNASFFSFSSRDDAEEKEVALVVPQTCDLVEEVPISQPRRNSKKMIVAEMEKWVAEEVAEAKLVMNADHEEAMKVAISRKDKEHEEAMSRKDKEHEEAMKVAISRKDKAYGDILQAMIAEHDIFSRDYMDYMEKKHAMEEEYKGKMKEHCTFICQKLLDHHQGC